ncbi:MAG: hypothetical protein HYZ86_02990, partial [Candidatus Omnitrophica bacterium]|nr:hypothetical protein [Candidatus Omnitrophota bacterium]
MKRPESFLYAIILLLISTGVVSAGTTTLTTYYPAPSGNYDQLRLVPKAALSGSCLPGTLYVDDNNTLQYCGNSVWGTVGTGSASSPVPNISVFNASGSFTVPTGITRIMVEVWGGGGTGGANSSPYESAGGGGGGGYGKQIFTVTPGNVYTVTVGGTGGTSSFGNLISATGGSNGTSAVSGSAGGAGGAGGTSSAFINITGGTGSGGSFISGVVTRAPAGGAGGSAGNGGIGGGGA